MGLLQMIVRNEAVKSDPPEIYNARVVVLSLVLFGEYGLTNKPEKMLANLSSNIVSIIQAGAFAGTLFSTWLANQVGRRWSLIIASILVFIGVALQAAASGHIEVLYVGRLVAGIAIGIASTVNPLYVSENAPRGIRGLLIGLYQLTLVSGLTVCHNHFLKTLPPYVQHEMSSIMAQLEEEKALSAGNGALVLLREAWAVKSYRRRSVLCVTLMMWSNLAGTNAMTYYSPTIFASVGLSGATTGLLATGVYGIVKMVACAVFILFVTDTLGRRKSLICTGIVQGLALFYVGFYIRFDPPATNAPITAPGYITIIAIYVFAAVYQFGWGSVVWTYCSEIPPARLRALNMGMATASQWLFNFIVAKATPSMFATLGKNGFGTYFLYGSFCLIMVLYAWAFVPETKGLSLERMDKLFEQDSVRRPLVPARTGQYDVERDGKTAEGKDGVEYIEDAGV